MDRDIRRGAVPARLAATQARDLPVGPARHERDAGPGGYAGLQDLPPLPRSALGMGRDARPVASDLGYPRPDDEQRARR